jgi:hypothetical protein
MYVKRIRNNLNHAASAVATSAVKLVHVLCISERVAKLEQLVT